MSKEKKTFENQQGHAPLAGVSSRLCDSDHWFDENLRCLLGGEIALIKKGKQERIDRKKLADWILEHL